MKKFGSIVLTAAMVLSLTACGKAAEAPAAEAPVEEEAVEETVEEVEEVVEEAEEAVEETAEEASDVAITSYADYAAADVDTEVTVETYVQAHQSWWEDKVTVYSQNEDGAFFLYNMACSEEDAAKLVPGTKIIVTGYKSEWSGEVEIADATFTFAEDGETFIAEAEDVTDKVGTDALADDMNKFIAMKGLTVEAANEDGAAYLYNWDGSGSQGDDLYFNVSLNGETYTFTVESYLCDSSTDVYKAVETLQVGDVIDLEGFLYWYEGPQPHVTNITVQ